MGYDSSAMRADLRLGAVVAVLATVCVTSIEVLSDVVRLFGAGARSLVEYAVLVAGLSGFAALVAVVGVVGLALAARVVLAAFTDGPTARTWPGLFAARAPHPLSAPLVHSAMVGATVFVSAFWLVVTRLVVSFREPTLIGITAAILACICVAAALVAGVTTFVLLRGRTLLSPSRRSFDPLGSGEVAILLWLGLAWIAVLLALQWSLPFRIVFPVRLAASLTVFALILLSGPRMSQRLCRRDGRLRRGTSIAGLVLLAFLIVSALWVSDPWARRAVLHSPTLHLALQGVRFATDFDRDGYGSLFGEGDCAPFDARIHPGAPDVPGDGIDQNCVGGDFKPGDRPSPFPDRPVPAEIAREDFSILLVTIDTLRYDHTGAGGYHRPTTPNLDALAARGAWFEQFYSTGCLTTQVLPTLVTSRFMDDLPLGDELENRPGMPRPLDGSAVTLAEVLLDAGYRTAMFTALRYFDGWQIEQGAELFVNLPGGERDPEYETAPQLTDRVISWLDTLPADARWFAWVHYYEPHLPYHAHAGAHSFGDSEVDRYDGEVRYCDTQLGRLLAWIEADPERRARTVVAVTSDHGDRLGELGRWGHGRELLQSLIHVPLVITVPGAAPQRVGSPASTIDIAPTLAAIAGVDPGPRWYGRGHIGALAYGTSEPDRIVFAAEAINEVYAAITSGWKLVYQPRDNLWRFFDLSAESGEAEVASSRAPERFGELRDALINWREQMSASAAE